MNGLGHSRRNRSLKQGIFTLDESHCRFNWVIDKTTVMSLVEIWIDRFIVGVSHGLDNGICKHANIDVVHFNFGLYHTDGLIHAFVYVCVSHNLPSEYLGRYVFFEDI